MTRIYAAFVALVAGPDRAHAPGEGPLYHGLQEQRGCSTRMANAAFKLCCSRSMKKDR